MRRFVRGSSEPGILTCSRVNEGGHSIPENIIERRIYRSRKNWMDRYSVLVDELFVYDNSELKAPTLIAQGSRTSTNIVEEQKWQWLLKLAKKNEA